MQAEYFEIYLFIYVYPAQSLEGYSILNRNDILKEGFWILQSKSITNKHLRQ